MSIGFCSTPDVITFDQKEVLQAGEKDDLSNDTQIRVISSMEPEIHVRKLTAKFLLTTVHNKNNYLATAMYSVHYTPWQKMSQDAFSA